MTHEYEVRQSADDRKDAATKRIKEKIAVLELWERDGVPEKYEWSERDKPEKKHGCPTNLSEFNKWNDSSLEAEVRIDGINQAVKGVYHHSAPALDKDGRSDLKERAKELLASIKNRPTPKKELGKLKTDLRAAEAFTQKLVNENAELRNKIMADEEDMNMVRGNNRNLIERVAELERELVRLKKTRGLHTVK